MKPSGPPNAPTGTTRPPPPAAWRQPVVLGRPGRSRDARCAEVAGGTAADCTAVCCCCPCVLVSLLVLAVVKVPAGLCRRAFLRRRRNKRGGTPRAGLLGSEEVGRGYEMEGSVFRDGGWPAVEPPLAELSKMEREMWAQFYGGGFWRTPSQREG